MKNPPKERREGRVERGKGNVHPPRERGEKVDPPPATTPPQSSVGKGARLTQQVPKVTRVHKSKSPRRKAPHPSSKATRSVRFVVDSDPSDEEADTKEGWNHTPESSDERLAPSDEGAELVRHAKAELGQDECEIVDIVDKNHDIESDLESDCSLQMNEFGTVDSENELSIRADEIVDKVLGIGPQKSTAVQGTPGREPQVTPAL